MDKLGHVIFNIPWAMGENENEPAALLHPVAYFKSIRLTYERAEPNSFQEAWHLFGVTGMPDPMPAWFTIMSEPAPAI